MTTPAPTQTHTPPHWDLSNVYPSLESPEFAAAVDELRRQIGSLEKFFTDKVEPSVGTTDPKQLAGLVGESIERLNDLFSLAFTIRPYIVSYVATDSRNQTARKIESEVDQVLVRISFLNTRFLSWIGGLAPILDQVIAANPTAQAHAFTLREAAEQSKYLMSTPEEDLAAELELSGANAWGKLQSTITSQLTVDFELDGQQQKLPMPALINLRTHPDESVRRRAYEAENQAWQTVLEPLAACMNGVKGSTITLNKRRGRKDALHSAIDDARIDRATLEAMLSAMEDSLPAFRRYFHAKARKIGKERLAWWDLFAPVSSEERSFTFDEAQDVVLENFGKFSDDLRKMAQRAFDNHWIDAEQREGKRGGAFCMGLQGVKESRVLTNFDGSFDSVSTLAHELGHAFHNDCAFRYNKTTLQQNTPMTLAETASIMCETIVTQAILSTLSDPKEQVSILEASLNNAGQVVVDIYSRYLFEKEVFERREKAELSASELNEIMERCQKKAYGDGLDENYLQKYMWTWKPHYYMGLSFYNFPYTFGLLFGTGLYAIYRQRGRDFEKDYQDLLASTGEASAADLAARFGIDIRQKKFWADSLKIIEESIDRYAAL